MKTLDTSSTVKKINPCLHQMSGNIKMKNSIWVNMSVSCCNPYNLYRLHIIYINTLKSVKYKNKKTLPSCIKAKFFRYNMRPNSV